MLFDDDFTWVKLYRRSIRSRVFKNEGLWKVWTWCFMKANHEKVWVELKTGRSFIEVQVEPGQFIFGRKSAAKELNMGESTIWKRMLKLKNMQNINIESNSQYSLITIINWDTYQPRKDKSNSEDDKQVTAKEQASNTNKNDKNVKNDKNIVPPYSPPKKSNGKSLIPSDFKVTSEMQSWFNEQNFIHIKIESATDQFIDYWKSQGKMMKDWVATWRNGMRKAEQWASENPNRSPLTGCRRTDANIEAVKGFIEDGRKRQG